jgi:AmmeMemoRadiSam system protein B
MRVETDARSSTPALVRRPAAVAGSFYPGDPVELAELVDDHLAIAASRASSSGAPQVVDPLGLLVPHAGLVYSGLTAAVAWRLVAGRSPLSVVLLGTNHGARWLTGVGAWDAGRWATPLGDVAVDEDLAADVLALGEPFVVDRSAHLGEHSIEVQLPYLARIAPGARIVPLAVSAGTGGEARRAGERLGTLLAERRARGEPVVLAASSDAAHYPSERHSIEVNEALRGPLEAVDAVALAAAEARVVGAGIRGLACGMCGIEPSVLGLAALRAMGATRGVLLAASTSADAFGDRERTVGYLAAAFTA